MSLVSMFNGFQNPLSYFSPLAKTDSTTPEDRARFKLYQNYLNFYSGVQWSHKRDDGESLITANYCMSFVDKHAVFLAGKGFTISDDTNTKNDDVLEYLENIWAYNNKALLFYETAHVGSLFGDSFLWITRDSFGIPTAKLIPALFVMPRFHPEDQTKLLYAIIEYPLHVPGESAPKRITLVIDSMKTAKYVDGGLVGYEYHYLGEVPLVHFKNQNFPGFNMGKSDLFGIPELQVELNNVLTDIADTVAYHSSPLTLAYGVQPEELERGPTKLIGGLPAEAKVENLEMKTELTAALAHAKNLKRIMHQIGAAPEIAFGSVDELRFSNSSGLAIKMLYQPMVDVLTVKHLTYGNGLQQCNRLFLLMGAQDRRFVIPFEVMKRETFLHTDISFPDPLPRDEVTYTQNQLLEYKEGVLTFSQLLRNLGRTNIPKYIELLKQEAQERSRQEQEQQIRLQQQLAQVNPQQLTEASDSSDGDDDSESDDDSDS